MSVARRGMVIESKPVTQAERVEWALAAVLRAIETLRASPGDPARVLAVIARKREYDDARTADERAAQVAKMQHARDVQRDRQLAKRETPDETRKRRMRQAALEGRRRAGLYDKGAA